MVIGLFTISQTSCLGPAKINKWVAKEYAAVPSPIKKKSDYISVSSSLVSSDDRISTTEKNTGKVLPLVFYWQYDYKNTCTLNPRIPINNFTSTVLSYAGKKLKQKLDGQRVELTVEKIPNAFAIDDKGHIIVIIIYPIGWDVITIQPVALDMVVSYKVIKDDNTETKRGVITIPNKDRGAGLEMFQSLKKKTLQYLDQYNANITLMSKHVIDELITEL